MSLALLVMLDMKKRMVFTLLQQQAKEYVGFGLFAPLVNWLPTMLLSSNVSKLQI